MWAEGSGGCFGGRLLFNRCLKGYLTIANLKNVDSLGRIRSMSTNVNFTKEADDRLQVRAGLQNCGDWNELFQSGARFEEEEETTRVQEGQRRKNRVI